jgi:hypothetical protein
VKEPGDNKGAEMNEAMAPLGDERDGRPPAEAVAPFGPDLFEAGPAPPRPPAALQRLMNSLRSRSGRRGARLAAIALQAGITPPAAPTEPPGAEAVQAALWMELARENATLRREAARLEERQHHLSRRIQRARTRVQELRLKLLERQLGVRLRSLREIPLGEAWRERIAVELAKRAAGEPSWQIEPAATEPGSAEPEKD